MGAQAFQLKIGSHAKGDRRPFGQHVVPGALPPRLPRQGQGELSEAVKELCAEQAPHPTAQKPEKEVSVPGAKIHQVLSNH